MLFFGSQFLTLLNGKSVEENWRRKFQDAPSTLLPEHEELLTTGTHVSESKEKPHISCHFFGNIFNMREECEIRPNDDSKQLYFIYDLEWFFTRKVEPGNEVVTVGEVEGHYHCFLLVD